MADLLKDDPTFTGTVLQSRDEFGYYLQRGDQIFIQPGYAYDPEHETDTTLTTDENGLNVQPVIDYVYAVKGNSVLTCMGWTLGGCHAAGHVGMTGHSVPEPSNKARRLEALANRQQNSDLN